MKKQDGVTVSSRPRRARRQTTELVSSENEVLTGKKDFDLTALPSQAGEDVMTEQEVLARLSAQARGTLAAFLVETDGVFFPDLNTQQAQENLFLLKKAKFKRRVSGGIANPVVETEVELELHDAQAALRDLGRHYKLFSDRTESAAVGLLKVEVEYVERE